jgi:hypothetical protein
LLTDPGVAVSLTISSRTNTEPATMTTMKIPVEAILKVPSPSFHKLLAVARSASRSGVIEECRWSVAVLEGLMKRYPHVLAIGQELVLALLEFKEEEQAEEVLGQLDRSFTNVDEETLCRWGRLFKDQGDAYVRLPWSEPDGRAADPEMARVYYKKSIERYDQAYRIRSGYYPGINKATLLLILGTLQPPIAGAPPREIEESDALAAALLAGRSSWPSSFPEDETLWHPATAGEANLLRRIWDAAAQQYGDALKSRYITVHARRAMYRQVERIRRCLKMLSVTIPPPLGDPETFFAGAVSADGGSAPTSSQTQPSAERQPPGKNL